MADKQPEHNDHQSSFIEHVATEAAVHVVLDTVCEGLGMAYSLLSASPVNVDEDRWVANQHAHQHDNEKQD